MIDIYIWITIKPEIRSSERSKNCIYKLMWQQHVWLWKNMWVRWQGNWHSEKWNIFTFNLWIISMTDQCHFKLSQLIFTAFENSLWLWTLIIKLNLNRFYIISITTIIKHKNSTDSFNLDCWICWYVVNNIN